MAQIIAKQSKKPQGEIKTATVNDYQGTPSKIKNGLRSRKLTDSVHKPFPDKPVRNIQ